MISITVNGIEAFAVVLQQTKDYVYYRQYAVVNTNPNEVNNFQATHEKSGWETLDKEEALAAIRSMGTKLNGLPSYRWFRDLD